MEAKALLLFIFYGFALLLFLIGFSIPYWTFISIPSGSASAGLWQSCFTYKRVTSCKTIESSLSPEWFIAVQALEILGLIASTGGLGLCVLASLVRRDIHIIRILSGVGGIAAAILIMIGVIIYGAEVGTHLYVGFVLAVVGAASLALAGFASFIIRNNSDEIENPIGYETFDVGVSGTSGVIISPDDCVYLTSSEPSRTPSSISSHAFRSSLGIAEVEHVSQTIDVSKSAKTFEDVGQYGDGTHEMSNSSGDSRTFTKTQCRS